MTVGNFRRSLGREFHEIADTAMGARVQSLNWTIEGEMTAMLRPMGDSTVMKVNLAGRAFNPDNPAGHRTACVGLGILEAQLLSGVEQRLESGQHE